MTRTSPHPDLKTLAKKDHDAGRIELLGELKRIPKSEFHNVDPALLSRLMPEQRAKLFAQTDRNHRWADNPKKPAKHRNKTHLLRRMCNDLPLTVRSQLAGLLITSVLSGLTVFILNHEDKISANFKHAKTLPVNTSTWPLCNRLTPYTDGCVYTVTSAISWRSAADALDFDAATLASRNGHLKNRAMLQRGDRLTVWRGQIPLEN